jgi:hypothetical protein
MSKADEYREYAKECIETARRATWDAARRQLLDTAKMWMAAAQRVDGGIEARARRGQAISSLDRC